MYRAGVKVVMLLLLAVQEGRLPCTTLVVKKRLLRSTEVAWSRHFEVSKRLIAALGHLRQRAVPKWKRSNENHLHGVTSNKSIRITFRLKAVYIIFSVIVKPTWGNWLAGGS